MVTKLGVRAKLVLTFGVLALVGSVAALYAVYTIGNIRTQVTQEIVGSGARVDLARVITIDVANMRSAIRGVSLFSVMKNVPMMQKARTGFMDAAAEARRTISALESGSLTAEERAKVETMRASLDQWVPNFIEAADLCAAGRGEQANAIIIKKTTPLMDAIQKNAASLGKSNAGRRDAAQAGTESSIDRDRLMFVVLAVF